MTEIPLRLNEFGWVLDASIHDSYLSGFSYANGDALQIALKGVDGPNVLIKLRGVAELIFSDMYNGAIVSEVSVWSVGEAPDAWDVPDGAWNILFSSRLGLEDAKIAVRKIVESRPNAWLVQLGCSYGGSIVAICDSISIFRADS